MRARRRSPWIIATIWLLAGSARAADAPPLVLEHLTPSEGMPQGTVYDTLQDTQGFVWLATEDGLVRYDGHELYRYAHSRNAGEGLPGNFIRQIVEDAHHDLWIAIKDAGLARWNRATDSFTHYRHDSKDPASLASDVTRTVLVDPRGRIWIGTNDAGIDVLDPASGHIQHLQHDRDKPDSLSDNQIFTLALDRSGSVWAGTAAGLDRWQPERRGFVHFRTQADDPRTPSGAQVSAIIEDQSGNYWVGTFDGGLDRMDGAGRVIERFRHDPSRPTSLASDDVRALLEDHAGHLWVGTAEGLDLMERGTGRFSHYRHDDADTASLRDSFVLSLYQDGAGLVWIGTRAGGVSRWNPRSWELGGRRPDWLGGKYVTSFADAPNRKVWIGSMGGGLVQFDETNGEATNVDTIVGRHDALGDQRVMALKLDRHDTLWIGTWGSGLKKLEPNGRLESFSVKAGDPRAVSAVGVQTIFEARDGEIWLGMHDGGANVLDPSTGLIRQLPYGANAPGAISAASVTAIAEDAQGNVWIGTDDGGLDLARPDGTVIQAFRHDPADPTSLPSNTVYALETDEKGRVWVATDGGGLAQIVGTSAQPETVRFKVISREDGLASDTLYGMLSDSNGRLWLSSDAGLMRFDPESSTVKTYHREHGLQGEEFDSGAYHRLRDGRLCFGGAGGFNIFDPSRLTDNAHAPRVALTHLEVLGVAVPSATPYWLLNRILVDYRASIVSLDFGALDFISPKRNRLAYRVSGLSDRWIDLGTQHRVTLTNLDAGDHLIEVRAANADSVWSEPLRLTVHRNPAPWRSPWAYACYALAIVLLIVQRVRAHRAKIRGIVEAKRRLESEVALRTRELVESNRQLAEAARAKSNFLARMSHELRTPMNGVVGMTELLGRTVLSSTQARLTQTIRSSAQILLQIVNDLLDLSKIQARKVELESLPLDLTRLLEECIGLFAGAAEAKGIDLILCPPVQHSALLGDALRIRQIALNLIGNAVKFTVHGEVLVKADVEAAGPGAARLVIAVSDTGVGIEAATIEKIFEPFTQADESTTRRFGGTGLGLAICRELAELMGGTVTAESRLNVGSTFYVRLPLNVADAPGAAAPGAAASPVGRGAVDARAVAADCAPIGAHVLLVEDEPVNAAVAQGYLEELGCSSVWADSGQEAVARSTTERFDLIMMDLNMPAMDGYATTRLIRERERGRGRVPIIALTAHEAKNYRAACLAADMDDLLSKPYTLDQCAQLLRHWIEHSPRRAGDPARPADPARMTAQSSSAADASRAATRGLAAADGAAPPVENVTQIDRPTVTGLRNLRSLGQSDLYSKLVGLFQPASARAIAELGAALTANDFEEAAGVCHKFASSAANVGALVFARHIRDLERLCRDQDSARAARQFETSVRAALPALIEELARLQLRESA